MDDARTKLLNAAGPIFADQGFQDATVREICQAAGVNLAGVNYYFGDKEGLYIETVQRAHGLAVEQVPLPEWPPSTSPEEKLRGFVRTMVERMLGVRAAPWQMRLMMREILQPTAACRELVKNYFRPHFEMLLEILDEMLPQDTPSHRRAQLGFSLVGQCLYYRVAGEIVAMLVPEATRTTQFSNAQLADHIADVMLAALGRLEPLGASPAGGDGTGQTATEVDERANYVDAPMNHGQEASNVNSSSE